MAGIGDPDDVSVGGLGRPEELEEVEGGFGGQAEEGGGDLAVAGLVRDVLGKGLVPGVSGADGVGAVVGAGEDGAVV
jgi:hypothetical protein